MKELLLLSILLIVGCDNSTEPEDCAGVAGGTAVEDCAGVCGGTTTQELCDECPSLVFDCAGACEGTSVVDECGLCGGNGMQTTYVQECEEEYVCGNVTTTIQLGSDSYCTNSCVNGQYCSSYADCYSGSNIILGCDQNRQCITTQQQTEYVCDYQTVCEDIPTTSCP